MAKVRDVGACRITGKKTNNRAERGRANSESNFLVCHGDRDATSRPEATNAQPICGFNGRSKSLRAAGRGRSLYRTTALFHLHFAFAFSRLCTSREPAGEGFL